MIPTSVERVPEHTKEEVNARIRSETARHLARYYAASQSEIDQRLRELDEEWDIERALEANAATFTLIGLGLGTLVNRKFFAFSGVIAGFLLQHAVQGYCPPMTVLRRRGYRTPQEIERERYALKALRGDFNSLAHFETTAGGDNRSARLDAALAAVER